MAARRIDGAIVLVALASCAGAPDAGDQRRAGVAQATFKSRPEPAEAASAQLSADTKPAGEAPFELGCETSPPVPLPPRVELTRSDAERWSWACRAVGRLGQPHVRGSGYPTFAIYDRQARACMSLSIEDIGAFVFYAPPGRGEALRDFLAREPTPPDCAFEIGLDGLGSQPLRVGVRNGEPFADPIYAASTLEGARRFFQDHPHEASAGRFLNRYLETPANSRPQGLEDALARAASIELELFQKVEPGWLSDTGKQGYCSSAKEIASLTVDTQTKMLASRQAARFCP